jgi:adenylylsulfate kinase
MAQNLGFTVWLTGMLGAGKSTVANYVAARLRQVGRNVEILDEDELGEALWSEMDGSTKEQRILISRRLAFLAELLTRNGACVLVACTSPYKSQRDEARRLIQRYLEVYVDCPTDDLIKRDSTGKYKKALAGEIPNFVGITEPYEPPTSPEVEIHTNTEAVEAGGLRVFQSLLDLAYVTPEEIKVITGTKLKAGGKPPRRAGKTAARARPAARGSSKAKARKR